MYKKLSQLRVLKKVLKKKKQFKKISCELNFEKIKLVAKNIDFVIIKLCGSCLFISTFLIKTLKDEINSTQILKQLIFLIKVLTNSSISVYVYLFTVSHFSKRTFSKYTIQITPSQKHLLYSQPFSFHINTDLLEK